MSVQYKIQVEITRYDRNRVSMIKEACAGEWHFSSLDEVSWWSLETSRGFLIRGIGTDELLADVAIEDFCEHFTSKIWEANGKYCQINLTVTFLEEAPVDSLEYGEEAYLRWTIQKEAKNDG